MTAPPRSLWDVIRPLVYIGWAVAVTRFALDVFLPDYAMYFGVYYVMPVAVIALGVRRHFSGMGFWRFVLAMITVGVLVWSVPNVITYTIAQFSGWEHGRFEPPTEVIDAAGNAIQEGGRAAPHGETALGKTGLGALVGTLTGIAGAFWMIVWGIPFGWFLSQRGRKGGDQ